jgi:ribosomal protein S18 acetylase RimI-like enzyme
MTVTVRPIAATDAASFRECLDAVAREERFLALLEAPPLEHVQRFVAENISNQVPQVVAVEHERVVGWCDMLPGWHHTLRHCASLGMGLLPDYRGRRIGEALFVACLKSAEAVGISRVEFEVREDNIAAMALYARLGFAIEGTKTRGMRVRGHYINTVAMSLLLGDA